MSGSKKITYKKIEPYLFLLPAIAVILFVVGYPTVSNLYNSFFSWKLSDIAKPFNGAGNYIDILQNSDFIQVLVNSIIWVVVGVFLQMVIGLLLASYVDEKKRLESLFRVILLLPWIIPQMIVVVMWKWMLQSDLGIVNYLTSWFLPPVSWLSNENISLLSCILVNTWKAYPFWFIMLLAGLKSLPQEQVESARIDGASRWTIFLRIKIPHLIPVISATGILTAIWTMNYADLIFALTQGGPGNSTMILSVYSYMVGFKYYNFGQASALSIISLVIMSLIIVPYVLSSLKRLKEGGQ